MARLFPYAILFHQIGIGDKPGSFVADILLSDSLIPAQRVRQRTAATGDYYMLKCTDYTSVIAECGFLSNSKDEALLVTEAFQESIAQAIYAGLADYLAAVSGA